MLRTVRFHSICAMLTLKEWSLLDRTSTDLSHGKVIAHLGKPM